MWGHFLIVLNLRNPNLRSACAKERGNAHYWPFYVLCCFSAPSGPIWACEDTFWEYSISRIQIWDRLAQKYAAMRTMTHFMAQSVFLVFWVQSRQFLSPFPSLPFPFRLDLVIIVISSIRPEMQKSFSQVSDFMSWWLVWLRTHKFPYFYTFITFLNHLPAVGRIVMQTLNCHGEEQNSSVSQPRCLPSKIHTPAPEKSKNQHYTQFSSLDIFTGVTPVILIDEGSSSLLLPSGF